MRTKSRHYRGLDIDVNQYHQKFEKRKGPLLIPLTIVVLLSGFLLTVVVHYPSLIGLVYDAMPADSRVGCDRAVEIGLVKDRKAFVENYWKSEEKKNA